MESENETMTKNRTQLIGEQPWVKVSLNPSSVGHDVDESNQIDKLDGVVSTVTPLGFMNLKPNERLSYQDEIKLIKQKYDYNEEQARKLLEQLRSNRQG